MKVIAVLIFSWFGIMDGLAITCTKKEEPILVNGFVSKKFSMKIGENVKNCTGYCFGRTIMLDATLANGEQVNIRNVHFSCVPTVPVAAVICERTCTSNIYADEKASKSVDRAIGALKRVLKKQIGDFSYVKALEKTCCCKDEKCARMMDGRLRLGLQSNYKIS